MAETLQIEMVLRTFYANQGALRGYVFSATRDYHATEDILQETAIVVAKKASEIDAGRPLLPWFLGIARYQVLRWNRARGREGGHVSFELLEEFIPFYVEFENEQAAQRRSALKDCVEKLPPNQRRVVRLRYEEHMDCPGIAESIGHSIQAIYSLLKRMKQDLRKCVELKLAHQEVQ